MKARRTAAMPLPFSKPCDLAGDTAQLAPYYEALARFPAALEGQHPVRRWEYAMALRAIQEWRTRAALPRQIGDVGGAGHFHQVLATLTPDPITVIDPVVNGLTVEQHATADTDPPEVFDVLTCISVIEHVAQVRPFLRACHRLLKPGGLLFLTADYWDAEGPDTAHFHWMRERIYNAESLRKLQVGMRELGFQSFGEADWQYPGPQIYGYSVASVAMTKKETT